MKKLATSGIYTFVKVENVDEIDRYELGLNETQPGNQFEFFMGLGMVDYIKSFKTWLREFPKPIFIIATKNSAIIAWVYITDWNEPSKDGDSIYVLRAIETLKRFRSKRLGLRLLMLGLNQTSGYMVTKPLNDKAEYFFKKAGFMSEREFKKCPIDLSRHHGYLILPPFKKFQIIKKAEHYFEEE
ncbi:MAG: hypothetical protein JSW00_04275 [Thermoplasmata archaeon]|nr:MAG: hypothetical protein JSW00_04275 [Thermoplasmata archaeon]